MLVHLQFSNKSDTDFSQQPQIKLLSRLLTETINQCSCVENGVSCTELCSCVVCENDSETVIEVELVNDVSNDDDGSDDNQFVAS